MLMRWFPAVPPWDGLHPALVQFPVALLLLAPLLVLASLALREAWRTWAWAALSVMVLGTLFAWLAAGSGHAAGQLVDKLDGLGPAILRHEALAVAARNLFTLLTAIYALLLLVPRWAKWKVPAPWRIGIHAAFLVAYVWGVGALATAADAGGRLVHERGLRAMVVAPAETVTPAAAPAPAPVPQAAKPPAPTPR